MSSLSVKNDCCIRNVMVKLRLHLKRQQKITHLHNHLKETITEVITFVVLRTCTPLTRKLICSINK